jgi:hypothetical protein
MLSGCWSPRTVAHGAIRVVRRWPCRTLLAVGLAEASSGGGPRPNTATRSRSDAGGVCDDSKGVRFTAMVGRLGVAKGDGGEMRRIATVKVSRGLGYGGVG